MRRSAIVMIGSLLVLVATATPVAHAAPSGDYEITDLGTFDTSGPHPWDINNRGQIVGMTAKLGFSLDKKGEITLLDPPGGDWSPALAVNLRGQVVGQATLVEGTFGYLWHDGDWTNVTSGWIYSGAQDINNTGQVVGYGVPPEGGTFRAFLFDKGQVADLGDFGVGGSSWASGINDSGQVVGYAYTSSGTRAALWSDGEITDLGTLGGSYSWAQAISSNGLIAGQSATASGETHAFLWDSGVMTDLGTLGGTFSRAFGVNIFGQVVGDSTTESGERHAFVWENGVMTDLGTLGGTYSIATSINDRGIIVGTASTATEGHAVMWTR